MARLSTRLYRAARIANNVGALTSGDPERMARRGRNVLLAKLLGALGLWALWRRLWGGR